LDKKIARLELRLRKATDAPPLLRRQRKPTGYREPDIAGWARKRSVVLVGVLPGRWSGSGSAPSSSCLLSSEKSERSPPSSVRHSVAAQRRKTPPSGVSNEKKLAR